MSKDNWLVCGTRGKFKEQFVFEKLDELLHNKRALFADWKPDAIIEGCCLDSPDEYAERWAAKYDIPIMHNPSTKRDYLNRNIRMCLQANLVIAFWDGYSYGTAHTIAQATMRKLPVIVYHLRL